MGHQEVNGLQMGPIGVPTHLGRATWPRFVVVRPIRLNLSRTDLFWPKNSIYMTLKGFVEATAAEIKNT